MFISAKYHVYSNDDDDKTLMTNAGWETQVKVALNYKKRNVGRKTWLFDPIKYDVLFHTYMEQQKFLIFSNSLDGCQTFQHDQSKIPK